MRVAMTCSHDCPPYLQPLTSGALSHTLRWTHRSGRSSRSPPPSPLSPWTAMSTRLAESGSVWDDCPTSTAPKPATGPDYTLERVCYHHGNSEEINCPVSSARGDSGRAERGGGVDSLHERAQRLCPELLPRFPGWALTGRRCPQNIPQGLHQSWLFSLGVGPCSKPLPFAPPSPRCLTCTTVMRRCRSKLRRPVRP